MCRRSCPRQGYTLIELLVVIAIIAVLIGLLLPAVQMVREAANTTRCENNLKQMSLALNSYANTHGTFPSAYVTDLSLSNGMNPGWGWQAYLLPYIEQEALYQACGVGVAPFGGGTMPPVPDPLTQTPIPTYRCMSDPAPDVDPLRLNFALSNYRAVAGIINGDFHGGNYTLSAAGMRGDFGGVMYCNSRTRFVDITDGTANTLAIGERAYDQLFEGPAAIWPGYTGAVNGSNRIGDVEWVIDDASGTINIPNGESFSSRHKGGAYFACCDGSVHFIRNETSVDVLKALAGRSDGTVVSLDN
jgi:prepilin-type N-terminal cleavage/methylation domain-containing protein